LYRSSGHHHPRLGISAAARRVRGAVARNRIRRLVRESFRHVQARLGGLDVVVLVKAPAREATNAEILESIGAHWQRLEHAVHR
jgi:ribonuclease P protein component